MLLTTLRLALILQVFLFLPRSHSLAEADTDAPHGFEFGISREDALVLIRASGLELVSDSEYSKELKKVVVRGSVSGVAPEFPAVRETRLEFYNDRLMRSSLLFGFEDASGFSSARSLLEQDLRGSFGESFKRDRMFSYEVLFWNLSATNVLLSLDERRRTIELEYEHKPILSRKTAKDLDRRRKKDPGDPAKEMFIDSNYSSRQNH